MIVNTSWFCGGQGQAEVDLLVSDQPLSSPSWRPDQTLLTVLKQDADELSIYMVILADPPLVRRLIAGEDFFVSPVSWRNRHEILYTADGVIKTRDFADLRSTSLPFSATLEEPATRQRRSLQAANSKSSIRRLTAW